MGEAIDLVRYYNESLPNFWANVTECAQLRLTNANATTSTPTSAPASAATDQQDVLDYGSAVTLCLQEIVGTTPYVSSFASQLFWILLFGFMLSVAVIGNAIVIWIIVAHRRMRTTTNWFLLSLATADLGMSALNGFVNFIFMLNSHWPFGAFYCTLNNFIAHLTVSSSVFTITAMSVDRYIAIVRPLRPRMTRRTGWMIIAFIWIAGGLLSLPVLIVSTTVTYKYPDNGIRTVCYLHWPDGVSGVSRFDYVYNVTFLVLTYVIPVAAMAVTYPWMGMVLWKSQTIGEINERQKFAVKNKKRVVRMLIVVVIIFTLCWFPYHCYFLLTYHYPSLVHSKHIQNIYLGIYFTAMSNSVYNPLVYIIMNSSFRCYFKMVLCCWCGRRARGWQDARKAGQLPLSYSMTTFQRQRTSFRTSVTTSALHGTRANYLVNGASNAKFVEKDFCSL